MPDALAILEADRSKLLEEFLRLGDLRPGSITATVRKCGKASCHCAKPNDPGHDPQFRLTRKVDGKTVTESFPNPAALRKAQQEVSEFRRLQKLNDDLVGINEKICGLRPVRAAARWLERPGKKKAARIHQEIAREVNQLLSRIFAERGDHGLTDLEAVEKRTAGGPPSSRSSRLERAAAVRCSSSGSASVALSLWTSCTVSGTTFQASAHGRGPGASLASILFVPALSSGTVSGRCGTGH